MGLLDRVYNRVDQLEDYFEARQNAKKTASASLTIPLNFQQVKLDQNINKLSLELDAEGNLRAIPVLLLDQTKDEIIAGPTMSNWSIAGGISLAGAHEMWPTVPMPDHDTFVQGIVLSLGGACVAAGATYRIIDFQSRIPGIGYDHAEISLSIWMDVVGNYKAPILIIPPAPLLFRGGLDCWIAADLDAPFEVSAWGYDTV